MYKVIEKFADLQDNKHLYNAGDTFPREGADIKQARFDELAGNKNKANRPLIEKVADKPKTTKRGKKENDAD